MSEATFLTALSIIFGTFALLGSFRFLSRWLEIRQKGRSAIQLDGLQERLDKIEATVEKTALEVERIRAVIEHADLAGTFDAARVVQVAQAVREPKQEAEPRLAACVVRRRLRRAQGTTRVVTGGAPGSGKVAAASRVRSGGPLHAGKLLARP